MTMKSFYDLETVCENRFASIRDWWHVWTPESYELLFTNDDDFKSAMFIIGFVVASFPGVRLITFQIMSNHLHFTITGEERQVDECLRRIRYYLGRYFDKTGRKGILNKLDCNYRKIMDLQEARNVIVYNNRNGYVVHPEHSPFSYPWGANSYYYSPFAWKYYNEKRRSFTVRERRSFIHSHEADAVDSVMSLDGCPAPPSFCDIPLGESLFRDASHYFYLISKNIESQKDIAKSIGESVFYTDDELYRMVSVTCKDKYGQSSPSLIPGDAKIEIAKVMHYDYNASQKQICRMLKLSPSVLVQSGLMQGR